MTSNLATKDDLRNLESRIALRLQNLESRALVKLGAWMTLLVGAVSGVLALLR